ncbi:hypothetical protein BKA70DRAFT_1579763 [Coprinopsis sp. MPI-PUGE-AT-0042]|nr:hypothetical protein BKA70DRAFT_1579763 [Coprinopsis sp. MPI-PUGE-AT-0042]
MSLAIALVTARTSINALDATRSTNQTLQKPSTSQMLNGVSQNARSSIGPSTQAAKILAFGPLCELKSTTASFDSTSSFDISRRAGCESGRRSKHLRIRSGPETATPPAADRATVKLHLFDLLSSIPGKSLGAQPKVQSTVQRPAPPELPLNQYPSTTPFLTTSCADVLDGFGHVREWQDGRIEKGNVEACVETTKSEFVASSSSDGPTSAAADQETAIGLSGTRHNMWKRMEKSLEILRFGRVKMLDHARTCTPFFLHGKRRSQSFPLLSDKQSEAHEARSSTPTPSLLLLTHI